MITDNEIETTKQKIFSNPLPDWLKKAIYKRLHKKKKVTWIFPEPC